MNFKLYLFVCLFVFLSSSVLSNNAIDSLQKAITIEKNDSIKVELLTELAYQMAEQGGAESALKKALEAVKICEAKKFDKLLINTYSCIAIIYNYLGEPGKTIENFERAAGIAIGIKDFRASSKAKYNIALVRIQRGEFKEGLEVLMEIAPIFDTIPDNEVAKGSMLNSIGTVHKELKNYDLALKYYGEYLLHSEKIGNKEAVAFALHNIGSVYDYTKEYEKSIDYYQRSLLLKKELGLLKSAISTCNNLAICYKNQGDYPKALQFFFQAEKECREFKAFYNLTYTLTGIGDTYRKMGKAKQALPYLLESIEICRRQELNYDLSIAYQIIANTYGDTKDFKNAFNYLDLYTVLKDTLINEEKHKQILSLEAKFENEKKKLQIENLEKEKDLQESRLVLKDVELEKQNAQKIIFGGASVFSLILAVFIFMGYRQKSKANREITNQKLIVEEKNRDITDSITYARRLQLAILPPQKLVKEYLPESFILYKPKDIVAGDFYWMEVAEAAADSRQEKSSGTRLLTATANCRLVFIAAADCTGHGVPGAIVSVVCSNALNRAVKEFGITEPGKILDKVRELVIETFEKSESEVTDGMDISLCVLNIETMELQWAGAYNPLWIIRKDELLEWTPDKQPIGKMEQMKPFTTHKIELQKDDCLYIFTDGYADQFGGEKGKKLKTSNLKKLLLSIKHEPMDKQQQSIEDAFVNWKNDLEQVDDVCVIGVKV